MNRTLNNLALLSFERRAKKEKKVLVDCTKEIVDPEMFIKQGEYLILWSYENGFQEIHNFNGESICEKRLIDALVFGEKYDNDYVFHFGIGNTFPQNNAKIRVFRFYDQISYGNNDIVKYDLKFLVESNKHELPYFDDYMSHITSLMGRASCG